jgi:hypothetical protein
MMVRGDATPLAKTEYRDAISTYLPSAIRTCALRGGHIAG